MEERRTSLEIIAPTIEEAIERGLSELGLPASAVDVEVLDSGSKGLFGLGLRQARVRLTIKGKPQTSEQAAAPEFQTLAEVAETAADTYETAPTRERAVTGQPEAELSGSEEHGEEVLSIARETVQELLSKMQIDARLSVRYGEPEDPKDKIPVLVDIRGDDLSILIGPKAETLNALQYIAGLIIGKEIGHAVPLVVDVEGYRARRSQQIRMLARRMAEQAVRTGRRQVLEPMPANERRLIHIELREHPEVTTESIGEEPRRKVTINPK